METNKDTRQEIIASIDEINDRMWKTRGNTRDLDPDPLRLSREALEKSRELEYKPGIARGLLNKGMGSFIVLHDVPAAIENLNESLALFTELNDKKWMANVRLTLAIINTSVGKHEPAMYNALKGVDYYEQDPNDDLDKIMAYYVTGTVFKDLKKFKDSEQYYQKGLLSNFTDTSSWGGRIYTSLANIYTEEGRYDEAIAMTLKGLSVLKTQDNTIGESRALNDLGNIYKRKKQFKEALEYFFQGLKIREESHLKQFAFGSLNDIASVYKETGENEKAIAYLVRAGELAVEINQPAKEAKIYQEIGAIYKLLGNYEKSILYLEKFIGISLDLHEKDKSQKIDKLQDALLREKEEEIERLRNVELKEAYNLITEKNKEITDSIHYARRIQKALLAPDHLMDKNLGEHFILYKPKDIVSGDFYWATSVVTKQSAVNSQHNTADCELFYLAVCDSTGHG
nr:tetratricopeptide repeat protein [Bacteroidota bacterium]